MFCDRAEVTCIFEDDSTILSFLWPAFFSKLNSSAFLRFLVIHLHLNATSRTVLSRNVAAIFMYLIIFGSSAYLEN
uniref:Uncharacterized protein n=1 Tax=Rhizophora mucronata TaxID=61149 RepID=A0A2P2K0C5_RHIMU